MLTVYVKQNVINMTSASRKIGTGSFQGGKMRPGRAADHSPPSSATVMED